MRILFAGTPTVAIPTLTRLLDSEHEVIAVLTREDAPVGRGRILTPSPVGSFAQEHGLSVIKSNLIDQVTSELVALKPDVAVIVAFGALIKEPLLTSFPWVNLHFSLLPLYRGAAPVQHALLNGDEITGASTFILDQGLDTGPVLGHVTERIRSEDTTGSLLERLSVSGAELVVATLDRWEEISPVPQPRDGVSIAPKISVEMAQIRWGSSAEMISRHIRAMTPAPGAWTHFDNARVLINRVAETDSVADALAPGELLFEKRRVLVGTGSRPLELLEVTPQGKRSMNAVEWSRGLRTLKANFQ